jgi:hypothetical protein
LINNNKIILPIILVLVLTLTGCFLSPEKQTTGAGTSNNIDNYQHLWWFNDSVGENAVDYGDDTPTNAVSTNSALISPFFARRTNFSNAGYTDGTNQYFLADTNVFTDNKPFTFFCLFRPVTAETNYDMYCGDNDAFYINANGGNLVLNVKDGTNSYKNNVLVSSYAADNTTYYFLWGSTNTSHFCAYVNNGTVASACTKFDGAFSAETRFEFGGRNGAGYTKAYHQASGIWNYTLSRTEMSCVYENVVRGYRDFSSCDFTPEECTPSIVNTSWSSYTYTSCVDGEYNSSRYLTEYDANSCGTFTSKVFWDNATINCAVPTVSNVYLNTGGASYVYTTENVSLTYSPVYSSNSVVDWRVAGTSIARLNMPFTFKTGAKDFSTYANHGTVSGATWTSERNGGYTFKAGTNKISLPNVMGVGGKTFIINFKYIGLGGSNLGRIIDDGQFLLYTGGSTQLVATLNGQSTVYLTGFSYNSPYSLAVTYNTDGVVTYYKNGTYVGIGDLGTPVLGSTTTIGNRAANDRGLNGTIYDVVVFDRILSSQQIAQIYRDGLLNLSPQKFVSQEMVVGQVYTANVTVTNTTHSDWEVSNSITVVSTPPVASYSPIKLNLTFNDVADCGNDYSGINTDLTKQGTANCISDTTICKVYGCLNLTTNGGDYLSGVQNFDLTTQMSTAFWFNPRVSGGTESQGFFELGVTDTKEYIWTQEGPYGISPSWNAEHGIVNYNAGSSQASLINTWTHYVTTYDGSYLRIYKNGELIVTSSEPYGNLNQTLGAAMKIGAGAYGIDVLGYLDEFLIYNETLSQEEVTTLYDSQRLGTPPEKDLYVANVSFIIPRNWTDTKGHNEPRLNVAMPINITIKNYGTSFIGSSNYYYVWDNGTVFKTGTINLGAKESVRVDTSVTFKQYGWRKIYIRLDSTNAVDEEVEENNNYTINIPYLDSYWTLGHNTTTMQQALTYCLTSGNLADTRCDWYRGFVSENFAFTSGNNVDPRAKKGLENAIGCMINNFNPTKTQCIYAKNYVRGWGSIDVTTYTDVQALHELLWVLQANDIMMRNVTRAQFMGNATKYQAICQQVSTLYNTRPDITPGLDEEYVSGGNGWGFGSGIGSICDGSVGNTYPNSNNDLIVEDTYWYFNANDYWHNRLHSYLRGRGNATDSNYQERMYYKWYSENKAAPVASYLQYAGVQGFGQYNNAYCSMAKETLYSMLDYRYNGQTVFGDNSRLWRMISAGDSRSYEDIASNTENKWDIMTFYGLMCNDQDVKNAIFYLRTFGDVSTTESDANGGIPAIYNYYKLDAQTTTLSNLKAFQHYFYDTQNEIATFRPYYTYYNDTVLQFDGGQHKMTGHPNAQGRYHYYEGYEFLAYNQVPYNDNTRTEVWANTVSFSNNTALSGYIETCAGAILYHPYGDLLCSRIGNYPSFTYMTKTQTGSIENEWGSDNGLYGGLLNIIPMSGISTPVEEYVLITNTNVVRFVKVSGAPSLILDGVLNRDTEINVHSIKNNWVNFKAFDGNTYLNFSVDYTNVTGKMFATNSTVRYGYEKKTAPTGKGFYRRSYYQMNAKAAEWITSEVGYESVVPTKTTVTNGDDRGVTINGETVIFDTDGDGITYSTYTTDAWGLILINATHIGVSNATSVLNGDDTLYLGEAYSGLLETTAQVCTESIVNSSWSTPVLGTCVANVQTSSSFLTQYDANYCGTYTSKVFWDNFTQACGTAPDYVPDFNSTFLGGRTTLNFNVAAAIGNYTPRGGNPVVRLCNNGTAVADRFVIGVDTLVPADLRMFVDDDTTIANSLVLSTSEQIIAEHIEVDECVDLSFWLEARDSAPTVFTFNVGYGVY